MYACQMALRLDEMTASTVLQSLKFPTTTHRSQEINEAHEKTFEWIFRDPEDGFRPWSNFVEWLQTDGQLYWINGRAGSGKSTLMRYIYENKITRHLTDWAGNAGREVPSFKWSYKSLEGSLKRIRIFALEDFKICFFIDGVDEYDGDYEALVEVFQELTKPPHVKMCISSRPWLVFTDTLKGYPGLRLQDLTSKDIRLYVYDKLEANSKMLQLSKSKPEAAAAFLREIVTEANGVFLWVGLIVRSLLSGLRNRDDISDLQQRLEELPSDSDSTTIVDNITLGQARIMIGDIGVESWQKSVTRKTTIARNKFGGDVRIMAGNMGGQAAIDFNKSFWN